MAQVETQYLLKLGDGIKKSNIEKKNAAKMHFESKIFASHHLAEATELNQKGLQSRLLYFLAKTPAFRPEGW